VRLVTWEKLNIIERSRLLKRPANSQSQNLKQSVAEIIAAVRSGGDRALYEFANKYDNVRLTEIQVNRAEIHAAYEQVTEKDLTAIKRALTQIATFHERQRPMPLRVQTAPGIVCEKRAIALDRVGLYIPGGTAPLISTVLMLAVPAQIAGCQVRVLVTPPSPDGSVNPHILVAADLCGVTHIYKSGGAQAIAAMAYGTESIPKVDKIFGPGNSWVTEAKMAVSRDPEGAALDMPAGPSEVLVVVDDDSDAVAAAADLLAQAEHGPDSQVILVSTSDAKAREVASEISAQLPLLSRSEIARCSLEHSMSILAESSEAALDIVNDYAPEHLILLQRDARAFADEVKNAASIFIGPWTPESVGDYASGTNHVLPTYGYARTFSGLGTESFMKFITCQELTPQGLLDIGPVVERLAALEGLDGHGNAVSVRLSRLRRESPP
jgi:histidinol dehydrogenase